MYDQSAHDEIGLLAVHPSGRCGAVIKTLPPGAIKDLSLHRASVGLGKCSITWVRDAKSNGA